MWISKKKWEAVEKRIADLEGQVQGQPKALKYQVVLNVGNISERDCEDAFRKFIQSVRSDHKSGRSSSTSPYTGTFGKTK